jgi:hypothetical protein
MSCEYCDLANYTYCGFSKYDNYQHDFYCGLASEPYTFLAITYNSVTKKFGLLANGDYVAARDINFCPMCGRKLTEEE